MRTAGDASRPKAAAEWWRASHPALPAVRVFRARARAAPRVRRKGDATQPARARVVRPAGAAKGTTPRRRTRMDEVTKLMVEQLRDAYSAEKQGLRAMPRVAKKATSQALKEAFQTHAEQTEHQVERLEQALEKLGARPGRKVCEGMRGLIEEAQSSWRTTTRARSWTRSSSPPSSAWSTTRS